ncbi:MAG: 50S ribosomal protein L9 [Acidobacteriota bacterium]|nr:50S ribosomal protein L9 [Blastocatellia bacterium]MDW8241232.1 50S ribosomal protein L9 [Acidobacteriota bacterium]
MASVQVLLREDVEHLGRRGEIVRVKAGYARNFLLPRGLAMIATPGNMKAIEQERALLARREAKERIAAQSLAEKLAGISLEFERKASEQGVFYGSVTAHDVAQALAERGFEVERRHIRLDALIKQPGHYTVSVKLYRDVHVQLPLTVKAEGAVDESEPAAMDSATTEEAPPAETATDT